MMTLTRRPSPNQRRNLKQFWIVAAVAAWAAAACAPAETPIPVPTLSPLRLTEAARATRTGHPRLTAGPAPTATVLYQQVKVQVKAITPVGDGLRVQFTGLNRPANEAVKQAGPSSPSASLDEEYAQVSLQLTCAKTPDAACDAAGFLSQLILANVSQKSGLLSFGATPPADALYYTNGVLKGGKTVKGSLYYIVPKTLDRVVLQYFVSTSPFPILDFQTDK